MTKVDTSLPLTSGNEYLFANKLKTTLGLSDDDWWARKMGSSVPGGVPFTHINFEYYGLHAWIRITPNAAGTYNFGMGCRDFGSDHDDVLYRDLGTVLDDELINITCEKLKNYIDPRNAQLRLFPEYVRRTIAYIANTYYKD